MEHVVAATTGGFLEGIAIGLAVALLLFFLADQFFGLLDALAGVRRVFRRK